MSASGSWINIAILAAAIFATYGLMWLLPKRLPRSPACLVMAFSLQVAKGLDNALGVKPVDLYDINRSSALDAVDLLTWILYPAVGYLFVYGYDRYRVRGLGISLYVLVWSAFGTAFEAFAARFGIFAYKGWTSSYSFAVYFIVQMLTIVIYELAKRGIRKYEPQRPKPKPP